MLSDANTNVPVACESCGAPERRIFYTAGGGPTALRCLSCDAQQYISPVVLKLAVIMERHPWPETPIGKKIAEAGGRGAVLKSVLDADSDLTEALQAADTVAMLTDTTRGAEGGRDAALYFLLRLALREEL